MCRLFETIRIENGKPLHLCWHEERMKRSMPALQNIDLEREIRVPAEFRTGSVRCKVVYEKEITGVSFSKYIRRPVRSLRMVLCDSIDYHLKFYDRAELEALFEKRGECDDIIIVKGGLITDSSIANLMFFDDREWFTPMHPLLEGTCRARLIAEGKLLTRDIWTADLPHFRGCKLINAMRTPEEQEMIPLNLVFS
ncbi:MAG: aminotransferase class IV family protein [Bacteroidota bacterium]